MNSNKLLLTTIIALTVSLSVLLSLSIVDGVYAIEYPYEAPLSGQNEVPPVQSSATGLAEFSVLFNDTMKYRVNITGISNASAAHIHQAKPGENGDVIADLLTPTSKNKDTSYGMIFRGNFTDSSLKGPMQGKTLEDLAAAMDSGETYVNIHTTYVNIHTAAYPDGEIRGQISNTEKPAGSTNSTVGNKE